jgi:predicted nucleotidyltransferase
MSFPSPDSDYDLRGVHLLPLQEIIGLNTPQETIEISEIKADLELDLVTHDIKKFFEMLLKRNGYVLEQLYSPLIVYTTPEHDELKAIAKDCITRYHFYHYLGFAQTQWQLFEKERQLRAKPLLYVYRVLLTGIHLMRSGILETNLVNLNEEFQLVYLSDLIDRKLIGGEKSILENADLDFYRQEYNRLKDKLETAFKKSSLPESPSARSALNDLLVRIRMRAIAL